MLRWFDRAGWLSGLLRWSRTVLPSRRGGIVLMAIALTILSLVVHVLWLMTDNRLIGLCGFVLLHIAIIAGFFGGLLAEALGRGYRE